MLEEYFAKLKNKKIGFVGCGVSNLPILRLACSYGISVVVRDKKALTAVDDELKQLGCKTVYGDGYLDDIDESLLFLSPAVRPDDEKLLAAASNGTRITSELDEFLSLCPCKTYGITGSDGKTTTTTLISEMLKASGVTVHLGGNIGKNLFCELDNISESDAAVIEISSFQLMKLHSSPDVAVVTNVSPNHLDWHKDMEEYITAKTRICTLSKGKLLVLNADDANCERFAKATCFENIVYTSVKKRLDKGVCFFDGVIYASGAPLINGDDILLPGIHNRANYCQAIAATRDCVSQPVVKAIASSFKGVEHRCEFVRELNGVKYYNSSIDSSPTRTAACLNSFKQKVICVCGGYDKKIPFALLAEVCVEKAKAVLLTGATADKIEAAFREAGFADYIRVPDLSAAVSKAREIAANGDIVVLSPACASFDAFKNFEERGNYFKSLVNNL